MWNENHTKNQPCNHKKFPKIGKAPNLETLLGEILVSGNIVDFNDVYPNQPKIKKRWLDRVRIFLATPVRGRAHEALRAFQTIWAVGWLLVLMKY